MPEAFEHRFVWHIGMVFSTPLSQPKSRALTSSPATIVGTDELAVRRNAMALVASN